MYFNQKFAHPYYSSGNSPNTIPLNYSVEYLVRTMFHESVKGVSHIPYVEDFAQKEQLKIKMNLKKKKNDMILTIDFTWATIFAVSIKNQLYGYFYSEDKNPAILLTLLVLALLLRKLSTMGGVVIHDSRKR